jgi:uncharacterized membrane protein YedE/YeeE
MKRIVAAAGAGALFGAGLVVSGMSNPNKVLNFLDPLGPWDPSLALVMAAAVTVTFIGFRLAWRRGKPWCEAGYSLPTATHADHRLLAGAALFGLGWGLAGYCPGPALTALVIAPQEAIVFVAAMLAGMALQRWQSSRG